MGFLRTFISILIDCRIALKEVPSTPDPEAMFIVVPQVIVDRESNAIPVHPITPD